MAGNGYVKALGEIALRVNDLRAMADFYERVVGLEVMGRFDLAVFFRLGEGFGGHTQVLALFDRSGPPGHTPIDPTRTTVDHIAFTIDRADYDAVCERMESLGLEVRTAFHEWVQWRSVYIRDPEENEVEFVCFDPVREEDATGEDRGE